ncbi:MAG TPA: HAD-IB family hydrolase [Acidimicrobiales bacterium]|nr:HAD-IB family hydrolase [Acidimicrobiales bacterium]
MADAPTEPPAVAAFDFDGTLTTSDSFLGFCRRVAGTKAVAQGLARMALRRPPASGWRDAMKADLVARVMAGRPLEEVSALAEEYAEAVARQVTAPMRRILETHRRAGDRMVIVSASLELYLRPAAARLEMDDAIGTRLEVSPDGVLTGRLDGPNCRGPEKAVRLSRWLDQAGLQGAVLTAYGNSRGDRQLLEMASSANRVRRGRPAGPQGARIEVRHSSRS